MLSDVFWRRQLLTGLDEGDSYSSVHTAISLQGIILHSSGLKKDFTITGGRLGFNEALISFKSDQCEGIFIELPLTQHMIFFKRPVNLWSVFSSKYLICYKADLLVVGHCEASCDSWVWMNDRKRLWALIKLFKVRTTNRASNWSELEFSQPLTYSNESGAVPKTLISPWSWQVLRRSLTTGWFDGSTPCPLHRPEHFI